jgi:hypothetical protein
MFRYVQKKSQNKDPKSLEKWEYSQSLEVLVSEKTTSVYKELLDSQSAKSKEPHKSLPLTPYQSSNSTPWFTLSSVLRNPSFFLKKKKNS